MGDAGTAAAIAAWQRAYAGRASPPHSLWSPWPGSTGNRSGGDALAAWRRWHEPTLDLSFSPGEWPWYAVLERARVDILASRHLPGMALNLRDLDAVSPTSASAAQLYRLARSVLACDDTDGLGCPAGVDTLAAARAALADARTQLTDAPAFAERLRGLVRQLADHGARAPAPQPPDMPSPTNDAAAECGDAEDDGEDEDANADTFPVTSLAEDIDRRKTDASYAVYSREYDQVAGASRWHEVSKSDPPSLGEDRRRALRRLAHQLQRRLLAARLRRWSFDQPQGMLDSRRLARLLIPAANPAIFRRESETPVPQACIALLVDQSGSMRGRRRQIAALSVDLAVRALELCGVQCEVLGFTTRYGSDNPLYRRWQQAGKPAAPGRLNAVRHVIYKSAQQPWRRARRHLGLLLAENFGRENIDGEALLWAASRLRQRPEPNKILLVLSDGVPYDAATVQANGRAFLEDHLRAAIARIEAGPIDLSAIGAGQDVARFYRHALTVRDPEQAAEVLFAQLGDLLTASTHRTSNATQVLSPSDRNRKVRAS